MIFPPSGMASRALTTRLSRAASNCGTSTSTVAVRGASEIATWIISPQARRRTASKPLMTALGLTRSGRSGWRREGQELLVEGLAALGRAMHALNNLALLGIARCAHQEI